MFSDNLEDIKNHVNSSLYRGFINTTLNYGGPNGITPLMVAVRKRRYDIVSYLIEQGCDVNVHEACGFTALHHAYIGFPLNRDIIDLLISAGARQYERDAEGRVPRDLASKSIRN